MTSKQQAELERIRHYVGTLDDFKSFWDQQAGSNTNAYSTPNRQGYGEVHPTRDEVSSPHWKEKKTEAMKEAVEYDVTAALKDIKKYNRSAQTSEDFENMALSIIKNLGFKPTGNNVDSVMDHLGAAAGGDDVPEDTDLVKELYPMLEGVDTDLGHTDNEVGMMANDLSVIARYAKDLEEMMKELEASGKQVDFPHWWQSKIVLAKEYMVTAKHYVRAELEKKPNAGLPTFEDFEGS